jgi:hypothetical protein
VRAELTSPRGALKFKFRSPKELKVLRSPTTQILTFAHVADSQILIFAHFADSFARFAFGSVSVVSSLGFLFEIELWSPAPFSPSL